MEGRQKGWTREEATAGATEEAGRMRLMAAHAGFTEGLAVGVREQEGPKVLWESSGHSWFAFVLFLPTHFCIIMEKHTTKFTILSAVLFTGIEYIHTVVQPSQPSVSQTFSSSTHPIIGNLSESFYLQ